MHFTERLRETGRNGLLHYVLLVLTSFRTALICWLLFYILTENINLNSTRLPGGGFLRDFIGFSWIVCVWKGWCYELCLFVFQFSMDALDYIHWSFGVLLSITGHLPWFLLSCLWASLVDSEELQPQVFLLLFSFTKQRKWEGWQRMDVGTQRVKNYHTEKGHIYTLIAIYI